MSSANITTVQTCYAAFAKGDIAVIIAAAAETVDWVINGRRGDFPTFGSWSGRSGLEKFFQAVAAHEHFSEFAPHEFHAAGDKVFVLGHYTGTIQPSGRSIASDWVHVFTFRDGKIAKFHEFSDSAQFVTPPR